MELGGGVSLPSLLLAKLNENKLLGNSSVIITDYEDLLLENLGHSISNQFEFINNSSDAENESFGVSIEKLDWVNPPTVLPGCETVEIILGSALIYSPDHAVVANIIR